jgi:D-alanyl-D-alanine carboxypeptidase (penicillin-binding protein 5/6)
MKRNKIIATFLALFFVVCTLFGVKLSVGAQEVISVSAKSALLADAYSGKVVYAKNENERLQIASMVKIMTLNLIFDEIEKGNLTYDQEIAVSENASSMGGSLIFLEPGETMSVDELLKSVIVASANDAALTLAEHVAGSEEAFVNAMNDRARELGMANTHFENVTGLDDDVTDHLTTARDIALMSRELLKHEKVMEYTTIWMDTVRNGEFGLTNTNRLVRFYRGITGLKTGSTSKAGFCISATAKRNDLHLIAVIMGAETSDKRNVSVAKLLDFGFANYGAYIDNSVSPEKIRIYGGKSDFASTYCEDWTTLINKENSSKITSEIQMNEFATAPIKKGEIVGKVIYKLNDEIIGENPIYCAENIDKITFFEYFGFAIKKFLLNL